MAKTKIVLDADVIIHFAKGEMLSLLPSIFTNYEYIILDRVYNEIHEPLKSQLDNQIRIFKNISILKFDPKGEAMKEFAYLKSETKGLGLGIGESACMVYCRYNHDVIGSSNIRDIKAYCQTHNITYLTTVDFLYHAICKQLISIEDATLFIKQVQQKDSKLPDIDFNTFVSSVQI